MPPYAGTHSPPPPAGHASETPGTSLCKNHKPPAHPLLTKPTPHRPIQSTNSRPLLIVHHDPPDPFPRRRPLKAVAIVTNPSAITMTRTCISIVPSDTYFAS